MFKEKSLSSQHNPLCHHPSSIPATSCEVHKASCSHFYSSSDFNDLELRRAHNYSPFIRDPQQKSHHQVDTRLNFNHSLQLPPVPSSSGNNVSVQGINVVPQILTAELAAAIPLGAPCIMPSPHYDELDGKPDSSATAPEMEQGHNSEVEIKYEVADISLQTDFKQNQREDSKESKTSQSPCQQQLEDLVIDVRCMPYCSKPN